MLLWLLLCYFIFCAIIEYRNKHYLSLNDFLLSGALFLSPLNALFQWFTPTNIKSKLPLITNLSDIDYFDYLKIFHTEKNYHNIQQEIVNIAADSCHDKSNDSVFFRLKTVSSNEWTQFIIKWYSKECDPLAVKLCPKLCRIIQSLPQIRLAMISKLQPRAQILPHYGPFGGILRYHLCIQEAGNCCIWLNPTLKTNNLEKIYSWKNKEDVIFDDTYCHYVYNRSFTETRIVLFLDIDRPLTCCLVEKIRNLCCTYLAPLTYQYNKRNETVS